MRLEELHSEELHELCCTGNYWGDPFKKYVIF